MTTDNEVDHKETNMVSLWTQKKVKWTKKLQDKYTKMEEDYDFEESNVSLGLLVGLTNVSFVAIK